MQRFGEKLKTLRKRQGMTLMELARALGYTDYSNSTISLIENGKRTPKIEFALKIADLFGVTMDQLTRDDLDV